MSLLGELEKTDEFTSLKHIELRETIKGHKKRNELRQKFKELGIVLILSDR